MSPKFQSWNKPPASMSMIMVRDLFDLKDHWFNKTIRCKQKLSVPLESFSAMTFKTWWHFSMSCACTYRSAAALSTAAWPLASGNWCPDRSGCGKKSSTWGSDHIWAATSYINELKTQSSQSLICFDHIRKPLITYLPPPPVTQTLSILYGLGSWIQLNPL